MKPEGASSHRIFWETTITPATEQVKDSNVLASRLMEELDKELENVQVPRDHRLATPWLRTTRWHEYMAETGCSTDQLRRWIALPQREETDYKDLHDLVECYFQQALELIESTDELVLQRLNSPDPVKK